MAFAFVRLERVEKRASSELHDDDAPVEARAVKAKNIGVTTLQLVHDGRLALKLEAHDRRVFVDAVIDLLDGHVLVAKPALEHSGK